ncbi:DUF3800 domain-containing protein [Paenibacillus apis]|uniref:DUF3800 domain-containing protein n=1 Tax=Paenibacillus apis TaxID=1792174 RepID=A0A919Y075_9BACL|nr:DUF3800 domain-containing protein [Paenibacillus apis]GIO42227.1 hypothetical protein J41TS4_19850 [Paenibacillus apis]
MLEDTESVSEEVTPEQKRIIKVQQDKENLMKQLSEGVLKTATARVAFILNHYPETRDSDRLLTLRYWETFQKDLYNGGVITSQAFLRLEQQSDITRARAKIQNTFKEFRSSEDIQRIRSEREDTYRTSQIQLSEDATPVSFIFYDETGKTQNYISVGGMWRSGQDGVLRSSIMDLRKQLEMESKDEFHFVNVDKKNLENYVRLIDVVAEESANIGFKAICFCQKGSGQKPEDIVTRLYKVGISDGLQHEIETGRISIPRTLNIVKDKEDAKDTLFLEALRLDVAGHIKAAFDGKVKLGAFAAVESHIDPFIQVADVFMGCLNRRLNLPDGTNVKDQLAKYFFDKFGINPETFETEHYYDFINIRMLD